jgi:hypothetical protein
VVPWVASDANGKKFVVVWGSNGSSGGDSSSYSVQGQRFLPEPSFARSLGAMLATLLTLAQRRRQI